MFPKYLLLAAAVMFGCLGMYLLFAPDKLDDWLGIAATEPQARTELRALYGGLELGLAVFLAVAAARVRYTAAGCLLLVAVNAGIAIGRSVGFAIDGSANAMLLGFLGVELAFAALGVWAWRQAATAR